MDKYCTEILESTLSDETKRAYIRSLDNMVECGFSFCERDIAQYSKRLSNGTRCHLKAAIGFIFADDILRKIELQSAIKIEKKLSTVDEHIWLSRSEVQKLLDTCDDSPKGERDRIALSLLVLVGLRSTEAIDLKFSDIKLQPVNGKMRTVLAICGKGRKHRTVPISDALANAIDRWGSHVGDNGHVLRSINQRKEFREKMSGAGLFNLVRDKGAEIGKPDLGPHDLRRTYSQIKLEDCKSLRDVKQLLGHNLDASSYMYFT